MPQGVGNNSIDLLWVLGTLSMCCSGSSFIARHPHLLPFYSIKLHDKKKYIYIKKLQVGLQSAEGILEIHHNNVVIEVG